MGQKILLVDGNSLIFRAYFASAYGNKKILTTSTGIPTNAVYAFTNMIVNLLTQRLYFDVKVAFDKGKKTFRHQKMVDYKAGRAKTPDELLEQLPIARELLDAAGIEWFELDDYEADDIIGALDKYIEKKMPDTDVEILTSDKDMFQLISERTKILIPNSGTSDLTEFGLKELKERWLCTPEQVPDLKGLMGDASDNLKGVPGIGEKTATKLIQNYGSLEEIYENIDQISGATHKKLIDGHDSAFLCREIATIETTFTIPNLKFQKFVISLNAFNDFLLKYEMFSIIKRLGLKIEKQKKEHQKLKVKILKQWSPEYEATNNAIYVQTIDDNYHRGKIIGIGISNEKGIFYLDRPALKVQLSFFEDNTLTNNFDETLNQFLKNPKLKKQTYDVKKTLTLLNNANYQCAESSFDFDLMIAGYALDANVTSSLPNYLNLLSKSFKLSPDEEVFGKGVKKTANLDLDVKAGFIGQKADYIRQSQELIEKKLKSNNQWNLYQKIDFPFLFVLQSMEKNGVLINQKELSKQTKTVLTKIQKIEVQAKLLLQDILNKEEVENFNLSSPKQLQKLLFHDLQLPNLDKGSTGKEVLEKLVSAHPIINLILEHRKYSKLYSTYLKGFEKYIFPDGRVHTIFNQTLTNTGRLSSIEPNLQNISIRDEEQKQVRKIFVATPDAEFLSFDYSQIELRVLAQLAPEKKLIQFFNEGHDVHNQTARELYSLTTDDQVSAEMRRTAKIFNFGIIYGLSDYGLAKDLNISIPAAKLLIQKYYQEFPDILDFKERTIAFAKTNGFVLTAANRKRNIPELSEKNNYLVRQFGERIAVNMPVQGTAADLLKVAMINIFDQLKKQKFQTKIVGQIHDEIIFEVPKTELKKITPMIQKEMELAYEKLLVLVGKKEELKIKLAVTSGVGKNWLELK